jgi:DNA-binding NtrC family response regulator
MDVLVIDDDRLALRATTRALTAAGHRVRAADNMNHASHILALRSYQAIVSDQDLVGTDSGAKTVGFLRPKLRSPALVVMYTGNPNDARRDAPSDAVVVTKPHIDEVVRALQG